ncbi:hypothetical protein AB6D11_18605 [Vibrio splendidus]
MLIEISERTLLSGNANGLDKVYFLLDKPWFSLLFILGILLYSIKINHNMTSHGPPFLSYFLPTCVNHGEAQTRCLLLILQAMLIWGQYSGNLVQLEKMNDPMVLPVTDVSTTKLDEQCSSWDLLLKNNNVYIDCLKSNQEWSSYIFPLNGTVPTGLLGFSVRDCNGTRCLKVTVDNLPFMMHVISPEFLLSSINNVINGVVTQIEPLRAARRSNERHRQSTFNQWQQIQRAKTEDIK